jgi:hypothetical protein
MNPITNLFHLHLKGGPRIVCKIVFALVTAGSLKLPIFKGRRKTKRFAHSQVPSNVIEEFAISLHIKISGRRVFSQLPLNFSN